MQRQPTFHPSEGLRILIVAVAVVATACTAGSSSTTTEGTPATNRVDCSGVIDTIAQPGPSFSNEVLDVIALPADPLDLGRDGDAGTPYEGFRFAKFGLVIRADRAVTLEIVDVQPGSAVMQWIPLQEPNQPTTQLHVGPCQGDGNEWIAFSGGVWVTDDPTCVTLATTTDGRTEEVRLGVEARCP